MEILANNSYIAIAVAIAIAFVIRIGYVTLFKGVFHLTFEHAPGRALAYFLGWSLFISWLYWSYVEVLFSGVTILGWLTLFFLFFVLFPWIFRYLRGKNGKPDWLFELFPTQTMLTLEERYIVAKVGDVFSQQLIAGILVLLFAQTGASYQLTVVIFVALFALSHLYLFFTSGFMWGLHYTTISLAGGFAIPFLILFVSGGIVYALIFHMLFYVFSAAFFASLPKPSKLVCQDVLQTDTVPGM